MINSAPRHLLFVVETYKYTLIMNMNFIFGIFIAIVKYQCLKQLLYNKGLCTNWINTYSVHMIIDYPMGMVKHSYSASELMSFRSTPRQLIIPDQEVMTRLKGWEF